MANHSDIKTPHSQGMKESITDFLTQCGLDISHKDLGQTANRVAELWKTQFLSGYTQSAKEILANPVMGETRPDAVFVTNLSFHSMCPHHLLPYSGEAHIAYIPSDKLTGFGRVAKLLECFSQRLTLQERITAEVTTALMEHLDALGAGCVLKAHHHCLALPDERHNHSKILTSSFLGTFQEREDLRNQLFSYIQKTG